MTGANPFLRNQEFSQVLNHVLVSGRWDWSQPLPFVLCSDSSIGGSALFWGNLSGVTPSTLTWPLLIMRSLSSRHLSWGRPLPPPRTHWVLFYLRQGTRRNLHLAVRIGKEGMFAAGEWLGDKPEAKVRWKVAASSDSWPVGQAVPTPTHMPGMRAWEQPLVRSRLLSTQDTVGAASLLCRVLPPLGKPKFLEIYWDQLFLFWFTLKILYQQLHLSSLYWLKENPYSR